MSYSSAIGPRVQRNDVKGELSYLEQKGIENFRRLAYHLRAFLHAHRRVRVALEISRGQSGGVRAETPADRNIASCKCACMCAARLKTSPSRFIPWNIIRTLGEFDRKTLDRNAPAFESIPSLLRDPGQFLEPIKAFLIELSFI